MDINALNGLHFFKLKGKFSSLCNVIRGNGKSYLFVEESKRERKSVLCIIIIFFTIMLNNC